MKAIIRTRVKGLVLNSVYDVEKLVSNTFHDGREVTGVHLKKYIDKERKKFKTIVVPFEWVEILAEEKKDVEGEKRSDNQHSG